MFLFSSVSLRAETVPLTLLHLNDLHSHYKPEKRTGLGGIARLKTLIDRHRAENVNTLLLDGGDWSEGNLYYALDFGRTSIEIFNAFSFDATVVGNHDWLNGPSELLNLLKTNQLKTSLLATNLEFDEYKKISPTESDELQKWIQPSTIIQKGPLKIGLLGVTTFEGIYDKFFKPVKINLKLSAIRQEIAKLRKKADLVVLISHNGLSMNLALAQLEGVDIIVMAHDHKKYDKPVEVSRKGKKVYLVEAECWGKYLGKMDLSFDTEKKNWSLKKYELIQVDETIPESKEIEILVSNYDRQIKNSLDSDLFLKYGEIQEPLIHDQSENNFGNFIAHAYKDFTQADIAMEHESFASDYLYKGEVFGVDLFNAQPAIYSTKTKKAWTLKTVKISGKGLKQFLNLSMSVLSLVQGTSFSVAGLRVVYDPLRVGSLIPLADRSPMKKIEVNGKNLDENKYYSMAVSQGVLEIFEFLGGAEKLFYKDLKDTQVENWKITGAYLRKLSPLKPSDIQRGNRLSVLQSDLALYNDKVSVESKEKNLVRLKVEVLNLGNTTSAKTSLSVWQDKTPQYYGDDPNLSQQFIQTEVEGIEPGKSKVVYLNLQLNDLASALNIKRIPLYFILRDDKSLDPVRSNNELKYVLDF
jgi:2',3'-cyclic-nucleotide 2'-phosphodiesterase (5'-nucleotidase family)